MVDIDGRLLLDDQTLYVVSYQGNVAALDAQSGRPLWQHAASSYTGPGAGFGSVYISEADGTVQALDAGSATELWSTEALARRQLTAPVAFSNFVAVGDYEGYLHLLAQTDGRMAGRVRVDGDGLRAAPLTVGDLLFVYGNSGDLAAYKLK
tara:strand:- start:611 stop:1063 length:453 start_codon:yes stop_codon:yes gene_type:complete